MSTCGYLYCESCNEKNENSQCYFCSSDDCSIFLINDSMHQRLKDCLCDYTEMIERLSENQQFQQFHTMRYISHLEDTIKKLQKENLELNEKLKKNSENQPSWNFPKPKTQMPLSNPTTSKYFPSMKINPPKLGGRISSY